MTRCAEGDKPRGVVTLSPATRLEERLCREASGVSLGDRCSLAVRRVCVCVSVGECLLFPASDLVTSHAPGLQLLLLHCHEGGSKCSAFCVCSLTRLCTLILDPKQFEKTVKEDNHDTPDARSLIA